MRYRWLLPFTGGADQQTKEAIVSMAKQRGATLVAVALVPASLEQRSAGSTRMKQLMQTQDVLQELQCIAQRQRVKLETHNIFTGNVNDCLATLVVDLCCDCIIVATSGHSIHFLPPVVLQTLLLSPPVSLIVVRQPQRAQPPPAEIGRNDASHRPSSQPCQGSEISTTPPGTEIVVPTRQQV